MNSPSSTSLFGERERTIAVRPGLEIVYGEFRLPEARTFHFRTCGDACHFAFVLSGTIVSRLSCLDRDVAVSPKHAVLWFMPEQYAEHECGPDEDIRFVCVRMRRDLLAGIVREDMHRLPESVRAFMENRDDGIFHGVSAMDERVCEAALEFFKCPYQGTAEKLFFEGKALELVSHFMAGLLEPGVAFGSRDHMCGDKRLQHAQRILMDNMAQPPSLPELAEMVGLSQSSLTRGFRSETGVSVFEFLRTRRLEKARALLESTDRNITEIAYLVGFSSPSHLTRRFRDRFAVTPGAYRRALNSDK